MKSGISTRNRRVDAKSRKDIKCCCVSKRSVYISVCCCLIVSQMEEYISKTCRRDMLRFDKPLSLSLSFSR